MVRGFGRVCCCLEGIVEIGISICWEVGSEFRGKCSWDVRIV